MEEEVKIECVVKGLVGEESQEATRGVIFQRTVRWLALQEKGVKGTWDSKTYLRLWCPRRG